MTMFRTLLTAAAAALSLAAPAFAHGSGEVHIHDAYARSMGGMGASGAVFFVIENAGHHDITITAAASDAAEMVQLHTHKEDANGVMQMIEIEGGVPVAAGASHPFERGADHVMLMGLTRELKDGDVVTVTLTIDGADPVTFDAVVDNARKPAEGGMNGHQMNGQAPSN